MFSCLCLTIIFIFWQFKIVLNIEPSVCAWELLSDFQHGNGRHHNFQNFSQFQIIHNQANKYRNVHSFPCFEECSLSVIMNWEYIFDPITFWGMFTRHFCNLIPSCWGTLTHLFQCYCGNILYRQTRMPSGPRKSGWSLRSPMKFTDMSSFPSLTGSLKNWCNKQRWFRSLDILILRYLHVLHFSKFHTVSGEYITK